MANSSQIFTMNKLGEDIQPKVTTDHLMDFALHYGKETVYWTERSLKQVFVLNLFIHLIGNFCYTQERVVVGN